MSADPDQPPDSGRHPGPGAGRDESRPGAFGALGVAALALLGVLCCAGPALLTAGALGAVGAWLASPWLIAAALAVLAVVTIWRLRRRAATTADGAAHSETTPSSPGAPAGPPPLEPGRPDQER